MVEDIDLNIYSRARRVGKPRTSEFGHTSFDERRRWRRNMCSAVKWWKRWVKLCHS